MSFHSKNSFAMKKSRFSIKSDFVNRNQKILLSLERKREFRCLIFYYVAAHKQKFDSFFVIWMEWAEGAPKKSSCFENFFIFVWNINQAFQTFNCQNKSYKKVSFSIWLGIRKNETFWPFWMPSVKVTQCGLLLRVFSQVFDKSQDFVKL